VNVLVDAQLPKRLSDFLNSRGVNSIHTLDLPFQNRTTDSQLIDIAEKSDRIVISKDRDFLDHHILAGKPKKLLVVSTGNITNNDLLTLFDRNLAELEHLFEKNSVIEINTTTIIVHE
jgi:predicted nuclease of predicted toxin-antitoxin system